MTDLRTLAQAVVDAHAASDHDMIVEAYDALYQGLGAPYDGDTSKRILAALNAERAQGFNDGVASGLTRGYARAMGEVVERCQEPAPIRSGSARLRMAHAAGWGNAMCHVADWAIERCE